MAYSSRVVLINNGAYDESRQGRSTSTFTHTITTTILASSTHTGMVTHPPAQSTQKPGRNRGLPPGAIAGIVVAVVSALGAIALFVWYVRRRRRSLHPSASFSLCHDPSQMVNGEAHPPVPFPIRKRNAYFSMTSTPLLSRHATSPAPGDMIPPQTSFFPEAMVRHGNRGSGSLRPYSSTSEAPPQYGAWDQKSVTSSRSDSRVLEPTDESPDPHMPLKPLRLEPKS
ncbi:hypothetical protein C8Q78DRAFT_836106 [Trametes maxima]|nr:hypothetical protein C8Q78DRAFT_836106 [Trametes maxima]